MLHVRLFLFAFSLLAFRSAAEAPVPTARAGATYYVSPGGERRERRLSRRPVADDREGRRDSLAGGHAS